MPFDASPTRVRRIALIVSIGALVLAGNAIYSAARSEVTGIATEHIGIGRLHRGVRVTRDASPKKFRTATNLHWGWGSLFLLVSVGNFLFYRKLDDALPDAF